MNLTKYLFLDRMAAAADTKKESLPDEKTHSNGKVLLVYCNGEHLKYFLSPKNEQMFRRVAAIADVLDSGQCSVDMCDIDPCAFKRLVTALSDADFVMHARDAWTLLDMIGQKRFLKYGIDKKAFEDNKVELQAAEREFQRKLQHSFQSIITDLVFDLCHSRSGTKTCTFSFRDEQIISFLEHKDFSHPTYLDTPKHKGFKIGVSQLAATVIEITVSCK